jgi:antibiotic biosynthesis monooxygenase (ABM) superfamily enzyme
MRNVVLVLNIASSLASLAMVLLGFCIGYVGLLGLEHGDYRAIILGVVLVMAFMVMPLICVIASTWLDRREHGLSVCVSLMPLLLIAVAGLVLAFFRR